MPESLPAVFTRLVADNVGQYEKSLVIDLGGNNSGCRGYCWPV
ncbi:plasmid segregation protein ParM (plasmid) [Escherichia coli]|nr:plasmid segregation protein ParM domain-containing protein [Escherichia coli]WHF85238.1 plasmid segregation protein ParM [Escherichia coli]